jgi:bifunctional non-homologous end joining protein LigD
LKKKFGAKGATGTPWVSTPDPQVAPVCRRPSPLPTVIDGEICSLDRRGRPQFKNLLFRRGNPPCFFAFDLLTCDGKDLRTERLTDRKQELRRLLAKTSPPFPLRYAEHVEGSGTALFRRVCELDLEGIVAKQKFGPYVTEREHSTWFNILNRGARQLSDPAVHWR